MADKTTFCLMLFFIIALLDVAHSENIGLRNGSQTACFHTVTHYYSNPLVTGDSVMYFSYKNDFLKHILLNISCTESAEELNLTSIKLSLPKREEDYCLESKQTNYTNCHYMSECDCCKRPKDYCSVQFTINESDRKLCDGKRNCLLNVTSNFLKDCPGMDYECAEMKCHSRWVEVLYTCKVSIPTQLSTTQDATSTRAHIWLPLTVGIVVISIIIIFVFFKRHSRKRKDKRYHTEGTTYHTEHPDTEGDELLTVSLDTSNIPDDNNEESFGEQQKPECIVPDMDVPLQFIQTGSNGLMVNEELVNIFDQAKGPISVIAIVGKCRTGKSYIMNRFFGGNSGFCLRKTAKATAKGIWLWAQPHPLDPSTTLILLDTEGLHDVEKEDETHDMQIFTLAALLSNCLIYNVMGQMDDAIIEELHLMTQLAKHIKTRGERKGETGEFYSMLFPYLCLLLRDYPLDFQPENGSSMDEYLEEVLKSNAWNDKELCVFNKLHECISDLFPRSKCFTVCCPAKDEAMLRNLDKMPDADIRPEFLTQTKEAIEAIMCETKPMSVNGNHINGKRFIQLAKFYTACMKDDDVPSIESISAYLKKEACDEALNSAMEVFDSVIRDKKWGTLPVEYTDMADMQKAAIEAANRHSENNSYFNKNPEYKKKLEKELETKCKDFKDENNRESKDKCEKVWSDVFRTLKDEIRSNKFLEEGWHPAFKRKKDRVVEEYKKVPNKGPMADNVLERHMEALASTEDTIISENQWLNMKA